VLFLISPDSVAESSYTLTELAMAQSKWPHPDGAVLPVMIRDTEYERIPNYVKAVTILEPRGNLPADVVHEVATMAALRSHRTRIVQALSTYWLPLVAVVAVALIVSALLWSDRIGGRQMSREQMATELGEMKARLQTVEAQSAAMKTEYDALQKSFARLPQAERDKLSASLRAELVTQLGSPNEIAGLSMKDLDVILKDPSLTDEEKNARIVDLITASLRDLDEAIDRQSQQVSVRPSPTSVDVETMKLKRLIDKRAQMFEMLRQIIDRYRQTATGIIDSIGR